MFSSNWISSYTLNSLEAPAKLVEEIAAADAVVVGAGAGLSTAAGLDYGGQRFRENFADFHEAFGITDMYSGGFYPFPNMETYWAWWSRHILLNRYEAPVGAPYTNLLKLLVGTDYFVLTTNVDHQFQRAGFNEQRMFATQGDYGWFQCSKPCAQLVYENEEQIRTMAAQQQNLRIPSELIPHCPRCGELMANNLRVDGTFVQPESWYEANTRYQEFIERTSGKRVLFLELGVGMNTPGIIKYPFWQMVAANEQARFFSINKGEVLCPATLEGRAFLVDADIAEVLAAAARAS